MISKDQFQNETCDFMTYDQKVAQEKADHYNKIGVSGDTIVAAKFGKHWCVMLKNAFAFTEELGIR